MSVDCFKMEKATQKIISFLPDLVDLRFLSGLLITETCSYFGPNVDIIFLVATFKPL